ncbi:class I SAM-dependent methyltransferase [Methanobrevibacter sp.]|uniref:class I SAM-dependent methyltransferase n=1 Tax=Methanobrevibacter sp. TaxID=66852 RepID=UPI00388E1D9B
MNDKNYWTEYYSTHSNPTGASSFAEFVADKLDENKNLIELGCGNGRDSIFFSKNNINVVAVDQVQTEIDYLNENYKNDNITFVCDDFTNLKETSSELIKGTDFDYIYSRFTFHSINEAKEDRTLDWISDNLNKGGCFLLEARSLNDPMFKKGDKLSESENFTTHYRRYMDLDAITEKLESRDFEIRYKIEDNDLAVYKDDNPYVIRIIAKKQ